MPDEAIDVVLVEDSVDDANFVIHALHDAGLGVRVHVARDGEEALKSIFGSVDLTEGTPVLKPKLIILDLKLPKVDGLEVLRRLKANAHTRSIPTLILSSSLEQRDLSASYELGANSYLVKAMDFEEFSETVRVLARYWLQFNQTLK